MPVVVYYVSAHPDDVLLFRGEVLHGDLHWDDVRVVNIVTTAGDAGRIDDWWWAREHGLVDSCARTTGEEFTPEPVPVNGHTVMCYRAASWRCYFLRLPDGNVDGEGFASTGYQSLAKLRDGAIGGMDTLPTAAVAQEHYSSWSDVVTTLRAIVDRDREDATNPSPWLNASDHDRGLNPGDHPDHYATADAVAEFAADDGLNRAWWVSYDTANRPPNLSGEPLTAKRGQYYEGYVELVTRIMGSAPAEADPEWNRWGAKSYSRGEEV